MRPDRLMTFAHLMSALCVLLFLAHALPVLAQDTVDVPKQVTMWNERAKDARDQISQLENIDSNVQLVELEDLRAQVAAQRDAALSLSRSQSFEANVAESRLALLGPVPEGGESDFASTKRAEIEEELYRLTAPQRAYQDSYLRSVSTIALLDARISELGFRRLTAGAQSPLFPGSWAEFGAEMSQKFSAPSGTGSDSAQPRIESQSLLFVLAGALVLVGLAIASVGRVKAVGVLGRQFVASPMPVRKALLAILRDIVGFGLAIVGMVFVLGGLLVLISLYPQFSEASMVVAGAGFSVVIGHWIGTTLFAPKCPPLRFVDLGDGGSQRAVFFMLLLGAGLGLETIYEFLEKDAPFSSEASGIAPFVILGLVSLALFGLARTIERHRILAQPNHVEPVADEGDVAFLNQTIDWTRLLTGAMKLSAIAAVLFALVGFGPLARYAVLPTIETLAVIALLSVVYLRLIRLISTIPQLDMEEFSGSLLTAKTILAFAFILLSAPIIAISWGLRPAEIIDIAVMLRDGVTIGNTTISLGTVVVFFAVFAIGYVATRWVQRVLQTMLLARIDIDSGTKSAIVTGIGYIGVVLAFVAAVGAAGIDLSNLAIVFGALSVGIGFGLQSIVSNFVSGIIMLVERPIKEGDSIEVGGYAGIVDKISVRATRIQSFDHDDVIIPNSELITGTVRNRTLTDRLTRIECSVGISYDADVHRAFDILYDIAKNYERAVTEPAPNVVMEQLGDSALMLRLYCFVDEVGIALSARSQMYIEIVRRFAEEGISIPFPQRDVNLSGAALAPAAR